MWDLAFDVPDEVEITGLSAHKGVYKLKRSNANWMEFEKTKGLVVLRVNR